MKKLTTFLLLLSSIKVAQAQTYSMTNSPFTLSPKWFFGYQAGMNFVTGAGSTIGPPVFLAGNPTVNSAPSPNFTGSLEESTSLCDTLKNLRVSFNSAQAIGNDNAFAYNAALSDGIGSSSSTNATISIPDPANPDQYYVFIANDNTGGPFVSKGINYYKFAKSGATLSKVSGPTNLIGNSVDESITASTDMAGGYWIISRQNAWPGTFYVWHVTSSGIAAKTDYATSSTYNSGANASVKINHCQTKIAWTGGGPQVDVLNWDAKTGAIGTSIYHGTVPVANQASSVAGYGIEFSPDGSKVYQSGLGFGGSFDGKLNQLDLSTGTWGASPLYTGSVNGFNEFGTMQLGPDGKIYAAMAAFNQAGAIYVGAVNSPNSAQGSGVSFNATAVQIKAAAAGVYYPAIYRGITNVAWLAPKVPSITETKSGCDVTFQYSFLNYFRDAVGTTGTEWSWDGGSTWIAGANPQTHTFSSGGAHNVQVRFKDQSCNLLWGPYNLSGSCVLPVDWLKVSATAAGSNNIVKWSTTSEKDNAYFIIERSNDGHNFTEIGRVSGSLNSNTLNQYQFLDQNSGEGDNYYRIVQYDINNSSSYSTIVDASNDNFFTITIAPNPSKNDFELRIIGSENKDATISVTDILGREIYNSTTHDINSFQFGSDFAKGTYIVKVISGQNSATQKIIKE